MRKAIARNLSASKQTIPHFYIEMTFDAEPTKRFAAEQKANFPCGVNDVIVAACARAVREFPAFRSRLDGTDLLEFPSANIGIAVGMEDALVVPVVVAADELSLEQLAQRIRRIVDSARKGKIEGLGQGVFTISNLGMFGIARFSAIINPPESAILAVGAVRDEAVVANGVVRPGRVLTVTLSCDHRVIDGLAAAKFLNRLKEIIEAPQVLAEPAGR
jgi:pyruvate dehydrogenase E2 component (dihydrolipoamide acetyltransferase)